MFLLKKYVGTAFAVILVLASAMLLSGCEIGSHNKNGENTKDEKELTVVEEEKDVEKEETPKVTKDEKKDAEKKDEKDEIPSAGFTSFSAETQTVGSSVGKESAKYTLASITDTKMSGFHRFVFDLESSETTFANVEARLVSSGGYVRILLDRVTTDSSGIIYQGKRDINEGGILKLYHAVTPNNSEEVYEIGISQNTIFYLHTEAGLKVVLDVKYPGVVANSGGVEDSMVFTTNPTTLTGTNTVGDVRFVSYSWSTESTLLKFIWGTASASGNTTPPTSVAYNASAKTVTVTFSNFQTDSVIGGDNTFSAPLSTIVSEVSGTRSGTTSTYVFHLTDESRYRIYRSTSPNQVILDIER